jgi:hypothetical protein
MRIAGLSHPSTTARCSGGLSRVNPAFDPPVGFQRPREHPPPERKCSKRFVSSVKFEFRWRSTSDPLLVVRGERRGEAESCKRPQHPMPGIRCCKMLVLKSDPRWSGVPNPKKGEGRKSEGEAMGKHQRAAAGLMPQQQQLSVQVSNRKTKKRPAVGLMPASRNEFR